MKKIDIHSHVYLDKVFSRDDGSFYMTAEEHLEMFEKKGVEKSVILPEIHPECGGMPQTVLEAEAICKKYPDSFIWFMNLDPRSFYSNPKADYSRLIEFYLARGAQGVGEMCANISAESPLIDNMLSCVNKYALPFTFHLCYSELSDYGLRVTPGLYDLEKLIAKYPKITFLAHSQVFWAHISGDGKTDGYPTGPVAPGGRVVELMRKYPNLCGDLSAGSGLNAIRRDREFGIAFLNEFQDRLYFGQDFCALKNFDSLVLSEYLDELHDNREISDEVYYKVCRGNAEKLLKF